MTSLNFELFKMALYVYTDLKLSAAEIDNGEKSSIRLYLIIVDMSNQLIGVFSLR